MKFFSYANCISYTRIALLLLACINSQNIWFFPLYAVSYSLDALDGYVARLFKETSKFGAVMDMVTDRISTALLLSLLQSPFWLCIMMLDIASHWVYTQSLEKRENHKISKQAFLQWYYNPVNLFFVCLFSEMYCFLHLMKTRNVLPFEYHSFLFEWCGFVFFIKQCVHITHLWMGVENLLEF
jgi:CDP-diacylglycerol--inositol 3-phosphatidyltransferase